MMDDDRPALCRNRLKDEGKPHPRSGCNVCRNGGMMGCPHERAGAKDHSAPTRGEVTQGDREAAAAMLDAYRNRLNDEDKIESAALAINVREGLHDDSPRVHAFASHRLATIEEAAKIAETRYVGSGWHPAARNAGLGIAEALRNLGRGV